MQVHFIAGLFLNQKKLFYFLHHREVWLFGRSAHKRRVWLQFSIKITKMTCPFFMTGKYAHNMEIMANAWCVHATAFLWTHSNQYTLLYLGTCSCQNWWTNTCLYVLHKSYMYMHFPKTPPNNTYGFMTKEHLDKNAHESRVYKHTVCFTPDAARAVYLALFKRLPSFRQKGVCNE